MVLTRRQIVIKYYDAIKKIVEYDRDLFIGRAIGIDRRTLHAMHSDGVIYKKGSARGYAVWEISKKERGRFKQILQSA